MCYVEAKHIACTYWTGSEHRRLVRSRKVTWPAAAAAAAAAVAWRPAVLAAAAAAEAVLVPACRKTCVAFASRTQTCLQYESIVRKH